MSRSITIFERWRRLQPDWVRVLVALNVIVYALSILATRSLGFDAGDTFTPSSEALYLLGTSAPARIADGEIWRLLTSSVLHGGVLHLAMNMLALWQLGPLVRHALGAHSFLSLWVFSALVAGIVSVGRYSVAAFLDHGWAIESLRVLPGSVGASGAVFGVFGFLFLMLRRTPGAGQLSRQLTFWLVVNLVVGFSSKVIDNAGHIGGFLGGAAFALIWFRNPRPGARGFLIGSKASMIMAAIYLAALLCLPWMWFGPRGQDCRGLLELRPVVDAVLFNPVKERDARDLVADLDDWQERNPEIDVRPLRDYIALRGRLGDDRPPTELPLNAVPIHGAFLAWQKDYLRDLGPLAGWRFRD